MSKSTVTDAQIAAIARLRRRNKSYAAIGRLMGLKAETVRYHCEAGGIRAPAPPRAGDRPEVIVRNGRIVRRLTPADDRRLEALVARGVKPNRIAQLLGRSRNTIVQRLRALRRARRRQLAEAA